VVLEVFGGFFVVWFCLVKSVVMIVLVEVFSLGFRLIVSKFEIDSNEVKNKPHYVKIIVFYLFFIFLYSWGFQLAFNMFTLARIFILKKRELHPGNIKRDVMKIKKRKKHIAEYKEHLRMESTRLLNSSSKNKVGPLSSREVALLKRNIGNKKAMIHKIQMKSIRNNIIDMTERRKQAELDIESEQKFIPVSKRKNDILLISARDVMDPEVISSVRNFEKIKYKDNGNNTKFTTINIENQLTDGSGTDDEKMIQEDYQFMEEIGEESDEEQVLSSGKNKMRKHTFLNESKDNLGSGMFLDSLGRKGSYNSERYRTPRGNANLSQKQGFLEYETNENLDSIKEVEKEIPLPPVKVNINQKAGGKRPSLERSFKFDFTTTENSEINPTKKDSESARKLQNNLKMEFLEDIEFGSSILKKSSMMGKEEIGEEQKRGDPMDEKDILMTSNLNMDFFKKKEIKKNENDFHVYESQIYEN
jgi:hypothetical protein